MERFLHLNLVCMYGCVAYYYVKHETKYRVDVKQAQYIDKSNHLSQTIYIWA